MPYLCGSEGHSEGYWGSYGISIPPWPQMQCLFVSSKPPFTYLLFQLWLSPDDIKSRQSASIG